MNSQSIIESIVSDLKYLKLTGLISRLREQRFKDSGSAYEWILQYGIQNRVQLAVQYALDKLARVDSSALGLALEINNSAAVDTILKYTYDDDKKRTTAAHREKIARAVELEQCLMIHELIEHECFDCEQFIDQFMGLVAAKKADLISSIANTAPFAKIAIRIFRAAIINGAVEIVQCLIAHEPVSGSNIAENLVCAVISAGGPDCDMMIVTLLHHFTKAPITKVTLEHVETAGTAPMLAAVLSHPRFDLQFEYAVALAHRLIENGRFEMLEVLLKSAKYPVHAYRNGIVVCAALTSPIAFSIVLDCPKFDIDACVSEILERISDIEIVSMLLSDSRVNVDLIDTTPFEPPVYAVIDRMIKKRGGLPKLVKLVKL